MLWMMTEPSLSYMCVSATHCWGCALLTLARPAQVASQFDSYCRVAQAH